MHMRFRQEVQELLHAQTSVSTRLSELQKLENDKGDGAIGVLASERFSPLNPQRVSAQLRKSKLRHLAVYENLQELWPEDE